MYEKNPCACCVRACVRVCVSFTCVHREYENVLYMYLGDCKVIKYTLYVPVVAILASSCSTDSPQLMSCTTAGIFRVRMKVR